MSTDAQPRPASEGLAAFAPKLAELTKELFDTKP